MVNVSISKGLLVGVGESISDEITGTLQQTVGILVESKASSFSTVFIFLVILPVFTHLINSLSCWVKSSGLTLVSLTILLQTLEGTELPKLFTLSHINDLVLSDNFLAM